MFLQGLWEKWWARISSSVTLSLWSFCPPHPTPYCLTSASFCAQQLPIDKRIFLRTAWKTRCLVVCVFYKGATRGRGSTDGEEKVERLKAREHGGWRGGGWRGGGDWAHVSDREDLIYLIRTEDVREFLWGCLWTASRSTEKENVCVCVCECLGIVYTI